MKEFSLAVILIILAAFGHSAYSQTGGEKEALDGMPKTSIASESMQWLALSNDETSERKRPSFESMMFNYCEISRTLNFNQIYSRLNEFRDSGYPFNDFFTTVSCQPQHYNDTVQSPILHLYLDDPCERLSHLKTIGEYIKKYRNDPPSFTMILNVKNTKGETFLDYINSMELKKNFSDPEDLECMNRMTNFICENGGRYEFHKNKMCKPAV